jgi:hypothetical protein
LNQNELIELIDKWETTSPILYKTNIKAIADQKGIKPRHVETALNVSYNAARSYTNASHTARIEFKTGLKLAELLNVNIEDFLKNI